MNQVERYIEKSKKWKEETMLLRAICLECGLEEDFKWNHPCYTFHGKNILLIHGFKDYCALLFHKGALLGDPYNILVQQTQNVQSARQIRFGNTDEVNNLQSKIKAYIFEAIEIEKAGLKIEKKKTSEYEMIEELKLAFEHDPELKSAFYKLTPGRQRGYLLFFAQAKQSKTRTDRIKKMTPKIFEGKGHNER